MTTRLLLTLALYWLAPRPHAFSQPTSTIEPLLEEGYALRERGEDDQALVKFQQAYRLAPEPRALAQIALAEQALGRWREAEVHIKEALSHTTDGWVLQRRSLLEQSLRAIEGELGSLEIRCNVAGATVEVAGRVIGKTPLAGALREPDSVVQVKLAAEGYFPVARTVTIHRGQLNRAEFTLVVRPAEAASTLLGPAVPARLAAPPRDDAPTRRKRWLWAGLGSGLVGVVVTVLAVALSRRSDDARENLGSTGQTIVVPAAGTQR
ncbi:MAG: TonB-dependent receptor [Myxococcaceae bacterium]|nr:TonB-dependent receptor [Myxococcaceae bacterium]